MGVIEAARALGKAIQQDERYTNMELMSQQNDEDKELQDLIGQFNLKRMDLNSEMNKTDKDQTRIEELNNAVKSLHQQLMQNKNMNAYNQAKGELDNLMEFVMQILRGSLNGEDPDEIEQSSGCSGSCGSCSGCH